MKFESGFRAKRLLLDDIFYYHTENVDSTLDTFSNQQWRSYWFTIDNKLGWVDITQAEAISMSWAYIYAEVANSKYNVYITINYLYKPLCMFHCISTSFLHLSLAKIYGCWDIWHYMFLGRLLLQFFCILPTSYPHIVNVQVFNQNSGISKYHLQLPKYPLQLSKYPHQLSKYYLQVRL